MDEIFQTLDYREYLKSFYENRKQRSRGYSYRQFAMAVGMDQSHLAKVLMGHMHLPLERITSVCQYLELSGVAAQYFESLVLFGRANTPPEAKVWFDKLQVLRPPKYRCLSADQLEYFFHWYTPVVRALVGVHGHGNAIELAKNLRPGISAAEVQQSLDLLAKLQMVESQGEGLALCEPHIGSGKVPRSPLLRNYHRQVLELAQSALEDVPAEERDVSHLVVGLDAEAFEDIKTMVRDFRLAIQKRIDQVETAQHAYHINFQVIPVSK